MGDRVRRVVVDHLGPRGHPARARHRRRALVEAALRRLHVGVRAVRQHRAAAVAGRGQGGRPARARRRRRARAPARRPGGGGDRPGADALQRLVALPHVPRQLRGDAGRGVRLGDRRAPRRPPPGRAGARRGGRAHPARRRGRSPASTPSGRGAAPGCRSGSPPRGCRCSRPVVRARPDRLRRRAGRLGRRARLRGARERRQRGRPRPGGLARRGRAAHRARADRGGARRLARPAAGARALRRWRAPGC